MTLITMQQSAAPICPVSPGGLSHHSDHHSDITGTTQDDENFIALLQYRDAYHILNLIPPQGNISSRSSNSSSSSSISPERIEAVETAYNSAREQVLMTLEQSSVAVGGGQRNMFAIGQQNYLELKLQALDQAYEELMPVNQVVRRSIEHDQHGNENAGMNNEGGLGVLVHAPSKLPETTSDPDVVRSVVNTKQTDGEVHTIVKDPSEDELDTIDIYFRPNPSSTDKVSNTQQMKPQPSSDQHQHPSDASIGSWDGSSIFSIISKTKQNIEESSVGSFTDMFGPILSTSGPGRSTHGENKSIGEKSATESVKSAGKQQQRRGSSTKTSQSSKESSKQNNYTNRRPPSGINVKSHARPKAQISPTSITDFPKGIHNDNHYDNTSNFTPGKNKATTIMGRGRMMQRSRNVVHAARQNSHEATEAARQGILRALSEENSECLPLEDDYGQNYLNVSNETQGLSEDAKFRPRDSPIAEHQHNKGRRSTESKHFFHGRSDPMPKESNSLMASVMNDKQTQSSQASSRRSSSPSIHDRGVVTPSPKNNKAKPTKPRSSSISSESSRDHNKSKPRALRATIAEPQRSDETYAGDSLLQSDEYSYDAIIQSGMELADELCTAFNHCWGSSGGELVQTFSRASSAASAALDAAASEFDRPHNNNNNSNRSSPSKSDVNEEESTNYSRSSHDEESRSINNQSVYTDGESTAFNTMSSFSRQSSSDSPSNLNKKKKQLVNRSRSMADPPPRMLV